MNTYTIFNIVMVTVLLPASLHLLPQSTRRKHFLIAAGIATRVTLVAYPWDFFAIRLGVWVYPDNPGITMYGVPVNDSIFIWICTYVTTVVLIAFGGGQARREGHAEHENAREQHVRD